MIVLIPLFFFSKDLFSFTISYYELMFKKYFHNQFTKIEIPANNFKYYK